MEGKKRIQLNAVLRPASYLSVSESLPKVVIPLFWVDEVYNFFLLLIKNNYIAFIIDENVKYFKCLTLNKICLY